LVTWNNSILWCTVRKTSNWQLLYFWRLVLNILVEVFPRAFFRILLSSSMFTTNLLCLIVCPIHEWCLFFRIFFTVIFLLSPFEKLHQTLFHPFILFLTFFSSSMFQMHLRSSLHFFLGSILLIHKEQHSKYSFL